MLIFTSKNVHFRHVSAILKASIVSAWLKLPFRLLAWGGLSRPLPPSHRLGEHLFTVDALWAFAAAEIIQYILERKQPSYGVEKSA